MKVHLGCGTNIKPGYINCDVMPGSGVDKVFAVHRLPFETDSANEIIAEHLIEHLTFYEFNQMCAECFRVLAPGGKLVLECPDLLEICREFLEASDFQRFESNKGHWPLIAQIYGHQRGRSEEEIRSQTHKSGYTFPRLQSVLTGVGFKSVTRFEPVRVKPGSPGLRVEALK